MTSAQQLLGLGAGVLLLCSCAGSGTSSSEPAPSTSFSADAPSRTSSSPPPPTSSASTAASPPVSVKPSVTNPLVVHIRNFAYVPSAAVVIVGQPIEIINDDVAAHTWSAAPKAGWAYTSGNLEKAQRATFPGFTQPGSYPFLCYYHAEMPSMTGVVTVKAAP